MAMPDRPGERHPRTIAIPRLALVLLVGPSGCGKSTFARRHFGATEVVSSDACRAMIADDEADQTASGAAFEVLHLIVEKRLSRATRRRAVPPSRCCT
jgi:protein phosphatase